LNSDTFEWERRYRQMQETNASLRTRMEQLEQENERLRRTTIEMTKEDVTVARMEQLEQGRDEARGEVANLARHRQHLASEAQTAHAQLRQMEAELAKTREELKQDADQKVMLLAELAKTREERDAARAVINVASALLQSTLRLEEQMIREAATLDQQTQGDTDQP
jgi:chromosome segregation ATPase